MLSNQAIKEFKEIFKEETGKEIPDDFALEQGTNLLSLFNTIYRPIKKEWVDVLQEDILTIFNNLSLELQKIAKEYQLTFRSTESLCESL